MKRFLPVVALVTVMIATADAFGYYHSTLGRWVTRDHGVGGMPRFAFGIMESKNRGTSLDLYRDGMNLLQYARSSPVNRVDPSGRESVDVLIPCQGKTLKMTTEWCCPEKIKMIVDAACSAYKTMGKTRDALWPLRDVAWSVDVPQKDKATHQRLINFFNAGLPLEKKESIYVDMGGALVEMKPVTLGDRVKSVDDVYYDLMDELGDDDGTTYSCLSPDDSRCANDVPAYVNPIGWKVHLCNPFFYDEKAAGRSQTIIHELSHAYQQTWDQRAGSLTEYTYIKGHTEEEEPAEIEGVPEYTKGKPNPFTHADTLAEFTMKWYVP